MTKEQFYKLPVTCQCDLWNDFIEDPTMHIWSATPENFMESIARMTVYLELRLQDVIMLCSTNTNNRKQYMTVDERNVRLDFFDKLEEMFHDYDIEEFFDHIETL